MRHILWLACISYLSYYVAAINNNARIKDDAYQNNPGLLKPRPISDVQAEAVPGVTQSLLQTDKYRPFPVSVDLSTELVDKDAFMSTAAEDTIRKVEACECQKSCRLNGTLREDGAVWQKGCELCTCIHGKIECKPLPCYSVNCTRPYIPEGKCCTQCRKQCFTKGALYEHDTKVSPRPCTVCTCNDGHFNCNVSNAADVCPPLPCPPSEQITVADQCCKSCRETPFHNTLGHLKPRATPDAQAEAARGVIRRLLQGEEYRLFSVSVDPSIGPMGKDTFKVFKNVLDQIEIIGTSGVAVVWGFHYYLKNYCNSHIAWEGSRITVPRFFPDIDITVTSNDRFRYYQNVCTAGYSTAWWDWPKWERHIDWMALNGINLALAFHGQEAIWERVYLALNLTRADIDEQFGGPAFLPWARMGNIRGWGGPLPSEWHAHTIALQHKILKRMRELGIIPVLPAFSGHVPKAFARLFPNADLIKFDPWNRFNDQYCCPFLLEPTDPLFKTVGTMFLTEYIQEFGTDHVYNCDTFNENEPQRSDLEFLRQISRSIYSAITDVDSEGIWILQGWLFLHELSFWTEPRVEAFITAVPTGKMIVLDLQSEQFPQYRRLQSYYGQPFIWCMLHNFGGTLGLFGSANIINKRVFEARNMINSTMIGTGITPEGINQNYVVYDLMSEMAYRHEPADLDNWFENYAARRYGAWNEYAVQAWQKLRQTVYNFNGLQKIRGKYLITRRPNIKTDPWTWYDPETVLSAWDTLLEARYGRGNDIFYKHDIVDVTRQGLQLTADTLYLNMRNAFRNKNISLFRENANLLLDLFEDLERILASSKDFLLGTWLEDAKSLAKNTQQKELYEYNARNQITLWGPRGEICDYANKQWSGVIVDYYKPRWAILLEALDNCLVNKLQFNSTEVNIKIFNNVEQPFTFSDKIYPTTEKGDSIEIAVELNKKWRLIKPSKKIKVLKRTNFEL